MKFTGLLLLTPILAFTQKTYTGTVTNKKTKTAIPFATVGLAKENTGTNADEAGVFILKSVTEKPGDTLIISCVGYETLKMPVANMTASKIVVELNEAINELADVVVVNKTDWKTVTLNDFSGCGGVYTTSGGLTSQLAQLQEAPVENAILTGVKICRMGGIFDSEKTIFRIRVYDVDTLTMKPSTEICTEIIEVKTKSRTVKTDLVKFNIRIPGKYFFVAVEWLKTLYNEERYSYVNTTTGKKVESLTYRPSIGLTKNSKKKNDSWMLNYNNIWIPGINHKGENTYAIAATIKY